jgi:hypothetical protein
MRRMIDGFVHRKGLHCESTAVRDVLDFYGLKISEYMAFGLDCTFGFEYFRKKIPYRPFYISGKICTFPNTLPKFLGIGVKKRTASNVDKAWSCAKELINRGIPVPMFVDMYYLDYMQISKEPWNHFGNHVIVLVGYDEEKGEAYVADSTFGGIQTITLQSLAQARNSKFEPFPPKNISFEINVPKMTKPLSKAVEMAIKETAKNMIYPPRENCGISGIRLLAEDIVNWPELSSSTEELKLALFLQYIDLEIAGTGGGNFRKMYSSFIKESANLLSDRKLEIISYEIAIPAGLWSEIANLIREAGQITKIKSVNKTLTKAKNKLLKIAKIEEKTFVKML